MSTKKVRVIICLFSPLLLFACNKGTCHVNCALFINILSSQPTKKCVLGEGPCVGREGFIVTSDLQIFLESRSSYEIAKLSARSSGKTIC